MPWFYNSYSGELANESGPAALAYYAALHTGTGWHELNIPGTDSFAQAAAAAVREVPGGTTPTSSQAQALGNLPGAAAGAVTGSISSSVLGPLFQKNIWLRAGEVVAGVVLVAIAVNAMFRGKPLNVVVAPVRLAAKAVP